MDAIEPAIVQACWGAITNPPARRPRQNAHRSELGGIHRQWFAIDRACEVKVIQLPHRLEGGHSVQELTLEPANLL